MNYNIIVNDQHHGKDSFYDLLQEISTGVELNDKKAMQLLKVIKYQTTILRQEGTRCKADIVKHLRDGIWELRPKNYRILFFKGDGNNFVISHYFKKGSQKTPEHEIQKAIKNRTELDNQIAD